MAKQQITLGFILLVLLTSSIYLILDDNVRIDIQNTRSIFQVNENGSWVVSGIEYVNLFDGTAKMRAKERDIQTDIFENTTIITRTALYKNAILVIERYFFDGNIDDVTLFPVSHTIEIIGADRPGRPYILQYEVQKLLYTGDTIINIESPQEFGHQMKVEWEDGNYYSKIYKYKNKDEGKITIKYRIDSDRFEKNVRLFDPPGSNLTITGTVTLGGVLQYDNIHVQSGGIININSSIGYLELYADNVTIDGIIDGRDVFSTGTPGSCSGGSEVHVNGGAGNGAHKGSGGPAEHGTYSGTARGAGGAGAVLVGGNGVGITTGFDVFRDGGSGGSAAGSSSTGKDYALGSAGGAGGCITDTSSDSATGGLGGKGAGALKIYAPIIDVSGTIYLSGRSASTGSVNDVDVAAAGGGGGGSGGDIVLIGDLVNISESTIDVRGGTYSAGVGDYRYGSSRGGAGSGARIKIFYDGAYYESGATKQYTGIGNAGTYNLYEEEFSPIEITHPENESTNLNPLDFNFTSLFSIDTANIVIDGVINETYSSLSMNENISKSVSLSHGQHTYYVNGTIIGVGDFQSEIITFSIDIDPPTINSQLPLDGYISDNVTVNFSINLTYSSADVKNLSLILNGEVVQEYVTTINDTNLAHYFLQDINSLNVYSFTYCNFLDSCTNGEDRSVYLDIYNPEIVITYPGNTSYITNVSTVNFTATDSYMNYCWYSNDSGITNFTPVQSSNGTNYLNITSNIEQNSLTVYCNDTRGNIGSDSVIYTMTPIEYSFLDNGTQTDVSGLGPIKVAAKLTPILDFKNLTTRFYNLTNGAITQYKTYTFLAASYPAIVIYSYTHTSTANPIYWDFIVCENDDTCYELDKRYRGIESITLLINGSATNFISELGTNVDINATSNIYNVSIDVDHPSYGNNYITGLFSTYLDLIITFFRKITLSDGSLSETLSYSGSENNTIYIAAHQYDEVVGMELNMSGEENNNSYPTDITIYKSNIGIIDRIFPGRLIANLIYLSTINTGADNISLFYSSPGKIGVEFFMDDGATLNQLTFDVYGFEYGVEYSDSFTDDSVLDPFLNEGMFRGGFALPTGTDLTSFIYDAFPVSGDLNILLWSYIPNGLYSVCGGILYVGDCDPGDQWQATINNYYSNNNMVLTTLFEEDTSGDNRQTETLNSYATVNFTEFNIWSAQEVNFTVAYTNHGSEESSQRDCTAYSQAYIGDVILWQSPWQKCEDSYPSDCNAYSRTLEDFTVSMSRNVNNSWNIQFYGVEETYGDDLDDGDCGSYSFVYNYTNNSLSKTYQHPGSPCGFVDTVTYLSNKKQISNLEWNTATQFKFNIYNLGSYDDEDNEGCDDITSTMTIKDFQQSLYNISNSSIISDTVFTSSGDIAAATLNLTECINCASQETSSLFAYLSANDGDNWEGVSNGVEHSFTYPGKYLKYRYDFGLVESGYSTNIPFMTEMEITTPKDFPNNITFDFGNDGIIDASISGELNLSNNPVSITIDDTANITSAFSGYSPFDHLYEVPLKIFSVSVGEIYLDNFELSYNPNPIVINDSSIYDFLVGSTNHVNFPIMIESNNGNITVDNIKYDYSGGNDTIEITAHNTDYSQSVTRNITYYYSRWDYSWVPSGVEWLYFAPPRPNAKNITPYGQTTTIPIMNITNYGYGGKDATLSIYQDDSNSCVDTYFNTNSTHPGYVDVYNPISHYDDFETDFGHWDNNVGINCPDVDAWGRIANVTPSAFTGDGTGPQNGGVGGVGTNFMYVEASLGGCYESGDTALVYFNETINYDNSDGEKAEFYFYAFGNQIDSLYLQENSTGSWVTLWEMYDISEQLWNFTIVDLSGLSGNGTLRFNYTRTSLGFGSDISLDRINVTYGILNGVAPTNLLKEEWTTIADLAYLDTTNIYLWSDYNCTYSTWNLFEPNYYFRQCVDGGTCAVSLV